MWYEQRATKDGREGLDQRTIRLRTDHGWLVSGIWKSKSTGAMKAMLTRVKVSVGQDEASREHLEDCRGEDMETRHTTTSSSHI